MNVVLFGTGYCFDRIFDGLNELERIVGIIDNDINKHGIVFGGSVQVTSVESISKIIFDMVIICSDDSDDMRNQLISLGVNDNQICLYKEYFLNKGRKHSDRLGKALDREFDIGYFRKNHEYFCELSDAELIRIYLEEGDKLGFVGAELGFREGLLRILSVFLNSSSRILEIGPFDNPQCVGASVKYFDIYDSDGLKKEAIERGRNNNNVPLRIDYVSQDGNLSIVDEKFDLIFSSHNIEHQPNLIAHIKQIENILDSGGYYVLIVPDKRFTFDYYAPISTVGKIIEDYETNKKLHSLSDVLNMAFFRTHNNSLEHWKGNHGQLYGVRKNKLESSAYASISGKKYYDDGSCDLDLLSEMVYKYKQSNDKGIYIDAHCNRFTPRSFRYVMNMLKKLGYIKMNLLCAHNTPYGRQEFCAVLQKT